jgi:hypothetical protein
MSRRTGSRARLKAAKRSAKNPDVKKKKPAERPSSGPLPETGTRPQR